MSTLYPRKASLLVGKAGGAGLDLSEMQFKFEVRRGDIQTPNSCRCRVYNLSATTVKQLKAAEFTQVVLQAGYEGNFGTIFNGSIKYRYEGHESNIDSYLDIIGADGDSAYNFAVVNTTLVAGSKPADHINVVQNAFDTYGVTAGQVQQITGNSSLPRGKVFYGMARDTMRVIANTNDATWSIQDGQLQTILNTSYAPGDAIKLTSATGLIGFPEQTQNGIKIRSLLNPSIKIGSRVNIDNSSIQNYQMDLSLSGQLANNLVPSITADGMYKVLIAEHVGDTRGNPYYTDMICIGVNASIPVGSPLIAKAGVLPYGP